MTVYIVHAKVRNVFSKLCENFSNQDFAFRIRSKNRQHLLTHSVYGFLNILEAGISAKKTVVIFCLVLFDVVHKDKKKKYYHSSQNRVVYPRNLALFTIILTLQRQIQNSMEEMKTVNEYAISNRSIDNIRLYQRMGYREFDRRSMDDRLDFVYMEKVIGQE